MFAHQSSPFLEVFGRRWRGDERDHLCAKYIITFKKPYLIVRHAASQPTRGIAPSRDQLTAAAAIAIAAHHLTQVASRARFRPHPSHHSATLEVHLHDRPRLVMASRVSAADFSRYPRRLQERGVTRTRIDRDVCEDAQSPVMVITAKKLPLNLTGLSDLGRYPIE